MTALNEYSQKDILAFIEGEWGSFPKRFNPSDIFESLGITGDDAWDFIENYSARFKVDLSSFLWYFHADEEGMNIPGGIVFTPPSARVKRIPISVMLLLESANAGRWMLEYPPHTLPKWRYDLFINLSFLFAFLAALTAWLAFKIF
ncbi:MAG: DUF1493 family protein [Amphiplicatus sp.]